tara:strand:+ start:457 stop:651 length:195 start_codon:yes stop_codon:yes gene_type:complete
MSRDLSEYIDDYCLDTYGHTNWGYKVSFTEDFLSKHKYDEQTVFVFFHKPFLALSEYENESEVK